MAEQTQPVIELELYLVRHGQSCGNIPRNAEGLSAEDAEDPELTPLGKRQAKLLGEAFSSFAFDFIISSGLRRAVDTAGAVALRQPENGAHEVEIHPVFTEWGITKAYEGKTMGQIQSLFPFAVSARGIQGIERYIINGEDDDDAVRHARALLAVKYLRDRFKNGEKVMVAGHACMNTFICFAALGLTPGQAFDIEFCNTGVTKIVFYRPGTGLYNADTHLVFHNDRSHLLSGGIEVTGK